MADRLQLIHKQGKVTTSMVFWLSKTSVSHHQLLLNIDALKHFTNHFRFSHRKLINQLQQQPLILPWRNEKPQQSVVMLNQHQRQQTIKDQLPIKRIFLDDYDNYVTGSEFKVIRAYGQGLSTKSIARQFNISIKTVYAHIENAKRKLSLSRREDIVKLLLKEDFWLKDF